MSTLIRYSIHFLVLLDHSNPRLVAISRWLFLERMRHPFNDYCCRCRSAEEDEAVVTFFFQYPLLTIGAGTGCWLSVSYPLDGTIIYWLQGYSFVYQTFWLVFQPLHWTTSSSSLVWVKNCFQEAGFIGTRPVQGLASQHAAIHAQVSFVILELTLRSNLT